MSEVRVVLSALARIAIMLLLGWFLGLATSAPAYAVSGMTWDFEGGLLDPWTPFVTPNGSIGDPGGTIGQRGMADIVLFDIDGPGPLPESLSVQLNVGQIVHLPSLEPAGGGVTHSPFFFAGDLSISVDIATHNPNGIPNDEGGIFELLFDGIVQDSLDFEVILGGGSEFGQLSVSSLLISEGTHDIAIRVTRPRENLGGGATPLQYIDNIVVTGNIPEPQTVILLGAALLGLAALRSRQQLGSPAAANPILCIRKKKPLR
jgi:hypothetical protein